MFEGIHLRNGIGWLILRVLEAGGLAGRNRAWETVATGRSLRNKKALVTVIASVSEAISKRCNMGTYGRLLRRFAAGNDSAERTQGTAI